MSKGLTPRSVQSGGISERQVRKFGSTLEGLKGDVFSRDDFLGFAFDTLLDEPCLLRNPVRDAAPEDLTRMISETISGLTAPMHLKKDSEEEGCKDYYGNNDRKYLVTSPDGDACLFSDTTGVFANIGNEHLAAIHKIIESRHNTVERRKEEGEIRRGVRRAR